jgi:hypothetical protein
MLCAHLTIPRRVLFLTSSSRHHGRSLISVPRLDHLQLRAYAWGFFCSQSADAQRNVQRVGNSVALRCCCCCHCCKIRYLHPQHENEMSPRKLVHQYHLVMLFVRMFDQMLIGCRCWLWEIRVGSPTPKKILECESNWGWLMMDGWKIWEVWEWGWSQPRIIGVASVSLNP